MENAREIWRAEEPSYNRTWGEIEKTLQTAIHEMNAQRAKYYYRLENGPRKQNIVL